MRKRKMAGHVRMRGTVLPLQVFAHRNQLDTRSTRRRVRIVAHYCSVNPSHWKRRRSLNSVSAFSMLPILPLRASTQKK